MGSCCLLWLVARLQDLILPPSHCKTYCLVNSPLPAAKTREAVSLGPWEQIYPPKCVFAPPHPSLLLSSTHFSPAVRSLLKVVGLTVPRTDPLTHLNFPPDTICHSGPCLLLEFTSLIMERRVLLNFNFSLRCWSKASLSAWPFYPISLFYCLHSTYYYWKWSHFFICKFILIVVTSTGPPHPALRAEKVLFCSSLHHLVPVVLLVRAVG